MAAALGFFGRTLLHLKSHKTLYVSGAALAATGGSIALGYNELAKYQQQKAEEAKNPEAYQNQDKSFLDKVKDFSYRGITPMPVQGPNYNPAQYQA